MTLCRQRKAWTSFSKTCHEQHKRKILTSTTCLEQKEFRATSQIGTPFAIELLQYNSCWYWIPVLIIKQGVSLYKNTRLVLWNSSGVSQRKFWNKIWTIIFGVFALHVKLLPSQKQKLPATRVVRTLVLVAFRTQSFSWLHRKLKVSHILLPNVWNDFRTKMTKIKIMPARPGCGVVVQYWLLVTNSLIMSWLNNFF